MQGHNRDETISPEYSDKTNSMSGWSAADTLKVSDTPEKSGDDSPGSVYSAQEDNNEASPVMNASLYHTDH